MKFKLITTIMTGVALISCGPSAPKSYPQAERTDAYDIYFGDKVADPYRWMENDTTAQVKAWVDAQNKVTRKYLSSISFREDLKNRMMELQNYEKYSVPQKKSGKYYFFKNDGLQNQSVLYCAESLSQMSDAAVILDPNTLSEDGTVALTGITFSEDGRYMAYTISRKGSDWSEIYVIDLQSGSHLEDHIVWSKFSDAQWLGDGFFYSAYDAPEAGREYVSVNNGHKVFYHKLGTPQVEDKLVYSNPEFPQRFYSVNVSDDSNYAFLYESGMGTGNMLYLFDTRKDTVDPVAMTESYDSEYYPIAVNDGTVYIITNYGAPRYRIMAADVRNPHVSKWREIVPEGESVLASAVFAGGKFYLTYTQDVSSHLYVAGIDGNILREVNLPGSGSVSVSGSAKDSVIFYTYTSFLSPGAIYTYDYESDKSSLVAEPEIDFDFDAYETKQVFFSSVDGTPVPMYITYRKGLELNGENSVYMTGYGGFNISLDPSFSVNYLPFLESGGVYVQVNLRGGGEYGESWHLAGTQMNKQNVFDDFISAAEYLIANGYSSYGRIGICGGSNGGLLIGACVNQRPDLFGAAVPRVGVMDMLRYHLFTIGWNWAPDYGTSADSEEMYRYLKAYSPLHNISNDGTQYPPVMVMTADHDDRVVPAHSFKYAAQLQWSDTGDAVKIIRIDSDAGHGAGKPISKVIEEQADIFAFIMYNTGARYNRK